MSAQHAQGASAAESDGAENGAQRQVLFRDLNEEIRRIADSFDVDEPLELCCAQTAILGDSRRRSANGRSS